MRLFIASLVALCVAVLFAPYARACDCYGVQQVQAVQQVYAQPVVLRQQVVKQNVQYVQAQPVLLQQQYVQSANILQLNSGKRGRNQLNFAVNPGDRVRFRRGLLGERLKIN